MNTRVKLKLLYASWHHKTKMPPWLIATTISGAILMVYAAFIPPIHTVVTLIDPLGHVNLATNYPIKNPIQDGVNMTGSLLMLYPWAFWLILRFVPLMD